MNQLKERETQVGRIKYKVRIKPTQGGLMRIEFWRPHQVISPHFTSTVQSSQVDAKLKEIRESLEKRAEGEREIARQLYGVLRSTQPDRLSPCETYRVSLETPKGVRWLLAEASSSDAARILVQGEFPDLRVTEVEADWESNSDPGLHISN